MTRKTKAALTLAILAGLTAAIYPSILARAIDRHLSGQADSLPDHLREAGL